MIKGNPKEQKKKWNNRYLVRPGIGSGHGSRGENLTLKNQIVKDIIEKYDIESITDIACGDLEILRGIEIKDYTGYDISNLIISENKKKRPEWDFVCGNIFELDIKKSDLVLALDILIHYPDRREELLKKIKKATGKVALLTDWATNDMEGEKLAKFDKQFICKKEI